jgi:hypothetical protein
MGFDGAKSPSAKSPSGESGFSSAYNAMAALSFSGRERA